MSNGRIPLTVVGHAVVVVIGVLVVGNAVVVRVFILFVLV